MYSEFPLKKEVFGDDMYVISKKLWRHDMFAVTGQCSTWLNS